MLIIQTLERIEDREFEASLDNLAITYLEIK